MKNPGHFWVQINKQIVFRALHMGQTPFQGQALYRWRGNAFAPRGLASPILYRSIGLSG